MFAASKTASVSGGYQISRSLRFNSADSTYLNRTPASAGNRRTWTFSTWVKRSKLDSGNAMLATVSGSAFNYFSFGTSSGDWLQYAYFDGATDVFNVNTNGTSVFRDVSAWYHIVLSVDTTQATASNRVKIYVNNVQQTLGGTYPTQNYDTPINNTISNIIGGATGSYTAYLSNQYMTDINFIDGQALTPSSFGATDAQTGVWGPTAFSGGAYGTNGFYLNFSDNSNTTAATLGKDYSGNGNNFTPNGFSVTAGSGNDSLVDSPTSYGVDTGVGGTVRGNYATWNPLSTVSSTFANGNLDASVTTAASPQTENAASNFAVSSGKWYCEIVCTGGSSALFGIADASLQAANRTFNSSSVWTYFSVNGQKYNAGTGTSYGATWTNGDVMGIALDMDAGTVAFYKNGTSQGTAFSGLTGRSICIFLTTGSGSVGNVCTYTGNFGQRPFAYTAPSGFKALCTQNLPTPTIGATTATQAGKFFNPIIYTGDGVNGRSITGVGFQPDFVWGKSRSNVVRNNVWDVVRGPNKLLFTDAAFAETTSDTDGWLSAFNSDGFSVATGSGGSVNLNQNGYTYVAWNWKANGAGVSNTAGSITSTVSANTTSGFSVLTYTATGSVATIGHGLGVAPSMVILKGRSGTTDWFVYHSALGATKGIYLNQTLAVITSVNFWNDTAPTSTVFTAGLGVGGSGVTMVAYCFAPIAGYSAFGSYTGNGSTNFIYTGFRPAYVLFRRTNTAAGWSIIDSARNSFNSANKYLNANDANAEGVGTAGSQYVDLLSNGFKCLDLSAGFNASGDNYIYMAFASAPFKYALAR